MTKIEVPNTPGKFISRWREQGPVEILILEEWKDEMALESWLMIAEAALFLDAAELFEMVNEQLTPAEQATIGLVRRRMLGDSMLEQAINDAIAIAKNPETRDLKLEGRLRMERGLARFENGDIARSNLNILTKCQHDISARDYTRCVISRRGRGKRWTNIVDRNKIKCGCVIDASV